jgi:hypothetical protein
LTLPVLGPVLLATSALKTPASPYSVSGVPKTRPNVALSLASTSASHMPSMSSQTRPVPGAPPLAGVASGLGSSGLGSAGAGFLGGLVVQFLPRWPPGSESPGCFFLHLQGAMPVIQCETLPAASRGALTNCLVGGFLSLSGSSLATRASSSAMRASPDLVVMIASAPVWMRSRSSESFLGFCPGGCPAG